jgi:RNA polymerase sigma-70 factor (ECF subfamily)
MPGLDEIFEATVARARAERPTLAVDDAAFVAYLAARVPADGDPAAALAELRAGDLLLACACAAGDRGALAAFEAEHMPVAVAAVRRMRASDAEVDEVCQTLRERLLVGAGGSPPRIADYLGRGDLGRWVKAIAVRAYIDRTRNRREVVARDQEVFDQVVAGGLDPELAVIRERCAETLRAAFFAALGELTDLQRTLLRHRHVDGLAVDDIAAIYQVHRATAHRWLADARDVLAAGTQERVARELGLDTGEYASLCRLVNSQLDWSLSRALG